MSKFQQIKAAVEREKQQKIRSEARIQSLTEQNERIFKEASELLGREVTDASEIEREMEALHQSIESKIQGVAAILDEKGVEY